MIVAEMQGIVIVFKLRFYWCDKLPIAMDYFFLFIHQTLTHSSANFKTNIYNMSLISFQFQRANFISHVSLSYLIHLPL